MLVQLIIYNIIYYDYKLFTYLKPTIFDFYMNSFVIFIFNQIKLTYLSKIDQHGSIPG